jgi:hypothetical protein
MEILDTQLPGEDYVHAYGRIIQAAKDLLSNEAPVDRYARYSRSREYVDRVMAGYAVIRLTCNESNQPESPFEVAMLCLRNACIVQEYNEETAGPVGVLDPELDRIAGIYAPVVLRRIVNSLSLTVGQNNAINQEGVPSEYPVAA